MIGHEARGSAPLDVLVACEYSGRVRDAFRRLGHNAVSVDLLPTEVPGPHIVGDVTQMLASRRWDIVVAHPPCTFLANSGVKWLYGGKGTTPDPERWREMNAGALFFAACLAAKSAHVAVENPIMHGIGRDHVARWYRHLTLADVEADYQRQIVQPWMFGDGETKATVLWRKGLPPLVPTNVVDGRVQAVHLMGPSPERWRERSRTYPGIADAIARQWSDYVVRERTGNI